MNCGKGRKVSVGLSLSLPVLALFTMMVSLGPGAQASTAVKASPLGCEACTSCYNSEFLCRETHCPCNCSNNSLCQ